MGEVKVTRQYLTREIVTEYQKRAEKLLDNGRQDVGERRRLRMETMWTSILTNIIGYKIIFHWKRIRKKQRI